MKLNVTTLKTKKTKFVPLNDWVLLKRCENEVRSAGGLHIPTTAQSQAASAKVVAVRKGVSVKVDDVVLIGNANGRDVEIDGETYILFKETELLGVLK